MLPKSLFFVACFACLCTQPLFALQKTYESSGPMPKGRYTVFVRDIRGATYEVRIFSPHEKVQIEHSAGSEFLGNGRKHYTGTYQVALRRKGSARHLVEPIPLFGDEDSVSAEGVFTPWNQRVFVLKGKPGKRTDLLEVMQYETSNTNTMRVFFVREGVLVPITWSGFYKKVIPGLSVTGGSALEWLGGGRYQTSYFTHEDGVHICVWSFDLKARRMVLLRDKYPSWRR
jgi:hypothetical protein